MASKCLRGKLLENIPGARVKVTFGAETGFKAFRHVLGVRVETDLDSQPLEPSDPYLLWSDLTAFHRVPKWLVDPNIGFVVLQGYCQVQPMNGRLAR